MSIIFCLSWVILLLCYIFVKSTEIKAYNCNKYRDAKIRLIIIVLLIISSLIPILNFIAAFVTLFVVIWWYCSDCGDNVYDIRVKSNSRLYKIIAFLNKPV